MFAEQKKAREAFVARHTGSAQVAADQTQEFFLRLARLPKGDKIENLPAFLFTIGSIWCAIISARRFVASALKTSIPVPMRPAPARRRWMNWWRNRKRR
ncbi:hypothetical protein [Pseudomonas sp. R5(2019)]|uniref:hypothetical protein n=1 Tax=Pseudomonas sp. R5(2019) TaxID=2697566 RepID=UPI0015B3C1D5|nr:hypothetical protein [Pseudomonas sp. R5(2019)]